MARCCTDKHFSHVKVRLTVTMSGLAPRPGAPTPSLSLEVDSSIETETDNETDDESQYSQQRNDLTPDTPGEENEVRQRLISADFTAHFNVIAPCLADFR